MTPVTHPWLRALTPTTLLCALTLAAASSPARAAPPATADRQVTDGVDRPIHDYSAVGDASSVELNPALLLDARGIDMVIRGYARGYDLSRGRGVGGWLSTSLLPALALGFGIQNARPSFGGSRPDFGRPANPNVTKISMGMSAGARESLALGLGIHAVRLGGGWLSRPDLDVGLMVRATNFASIGASLRVSGGSAGDLRVPTRMSTRTELAIRPLGTSLLEVAGGINTDTVDTDSRGLSSVLRDASATTILARGRVGVRWQGVSLSGEVEQVNVTTLDELTLAPIRRDKSVRGSIALGLSWDFAAVETGVHMGTSDGVDGVGVMARLTSERLGRVVPTRPVDVERVRLSELASERDFLALLARLERAVTAGERAVLLLDVRDTSAGWSTLLELRNKLVEVRNAGGHVFAYAEFADLRDLYMASVAEQVFVHPAGEVAPFGIASASFYYKDALTRLGVKVEALHVDEFKSAHEPFTRSDRSEADALQRNALLDDIFGQVVSDIAQGRGATLSEIRHLIDTAPFGPQEAIDANLADSVTYRDEVLERIAEAVGVDVRFARFPDTAPANPTWASKPYVGVVLVEGTIVDGESLAVPLLGIRNAGGDTIAQALRTLRADPSCRGIILRVNSPGGSALASDIIWREVDLTRMAHDKDPRKPAIVVSMGDVAASGGYYVATGARDVFASPTTITGSIGVVSLHFDVSSMLKKLDINRDAITRGANADINRYAPWTEDQRARLQASILRIYELFLERVAKARGMTRDEAHALARGRVYSGVDALEVGLIDELGGIERARARLAERMGVSQKARLPLRTFPAERTILDIILESVTPDWFAGVVERRAKHRAKATRALVTATRMDALIRALPLHVLTLYDGLPATMMDQHIDMD